ncbi:MAG TPA: HEAT repeat domain-containing protein [Gemmataceae bacterium]|nr:HEAT repeat domain-containing protein [Gemmataceae bacterium]
MSSRLIATLAASLITAVTASAAPREEEAKKYAADLKSKDAKVRATALTELGKLGAAQRKLTEPYTSDIVAILKDGDATVRAEAAKTLAKIDPDDKKAAIEKIIGLLKEEKSEVARAGQETGLGELAAMSSDDDLKKSAREALLEARKKSDSKREQKVIQGALQQITAKKKN